jgi:hypothetical protein
VESQRNFDYGFETCFVLDLEGAAGFAAVGLAPVPFFFEPAGCGAAMGFGLVVVFLAVGIRVSFWVEFIEN